MLRGSRRTNRKRQNVLLKTLRSSNKQRSGTRILLNGCSFLTTVTSRITLC
nr:MAG TPA: hypothetical protein [Caudoviricetes sp.]